MLVALFCGTALHAQLVQIWKGEEPLEFIVMQGDSMFVQPSYVMIDGHAYVDLGLPSHLLWAVSNVGADVFEADGDILPWSDSMVPSAWGTAAALPTAEQYAELLASCKVSWIDMNGNHGILFKAVSGQVLFLPASAEVFASCKTPADVLPFYWNAASDKGLKAYLRLVHAPLAGTIEDPSSGGTIDL